ncbi:hypothetical protein ADUPG1_000021 [Aduncisulcus paluster]|uniref:Clathrin/coatomer adaptor adaptin-like N-terminal domain-containing protein n=1 Tax=Aduncisulcus paluster TaxID=2918883 RepID=A0ABQ5K482_9EUKA|nr:hypothetical protein ADUPG1_000021 [Aduncisulcus paluster]
MAELRSAFKDDNPNITQCILKLLYIEMMGYPVSWAQMEVVKLVASAKDQSARRLGYLALSLLIDKDSDFLFMTTNSIKTDLESGSPYRCAVALHCLGSIGNEDILEKLAPYVIPILGTQATYLRKKAALISCNICEKLPDQAELFIPAAKNLTMQKSHSMVLSGTQLMTAILKADPTLWDNFLPELRNCIRVLKSLVTSHSGSSENMICGVRDPFIQVSILNLLLVFASCRRKLRLTDAVDLPGLFASLSAVLTGSPSTKAAGRAVLHTAARVVLYIGAGGVLRDTALDVLARFLTHKDNNLRYAALSTLAASLRDGTVQSNEISKHRATILHCLTDVDPTLRKRALDASLCLCDKTNIRFIVSSLLKYIKDVCNSLSNNDIEMRAAAISGIILACESHSPTPRWHLSTLINLLDICGGWENDKGVGGEYSSAKSSAKGSSRSVSATFLRSDIAASVLYLLSLHSSLQPYAVQLLLHRLPACLTTMNPSLAYLIGCVLGEYGHTLVLHGKERHGEDDTEGGHAMTSSSSSSDEPIDDILGELGLDDTTSPGTETHPQTSVPTHDDSHSHDPGSKTNIHPSLLFSSLHSLLTSAVCKNVRVHSVCVNALVKVSAQFPSVFDAQPVDESEDLSDEERKSREDIFTIGSETKRLLSMYAHHLESELQTRSVEMCTMLRSDKVNILCQTIPGKGDDDDEEEVEEESGGSTDEKKIEEGEKELQQGEKAEEHQTSAENDDLDDLLGLF